MVSVTLSVSPEIKREMDRYSEINWSGFIRKMLIAKTEELAWREDMIARIKKRGVDVDQQLQQLQETIETEPRVRKEYLEKLDKIRKARDSIEVKDFRKHYGLNTDSE